MRSLDILNGKINSSGFKKRPLSFDFYSVTITRSINLKTVNCLYLPRLTQVNVENKRGMDILTADSACLASE